MTAPRVNVQGKAVVERGEAGELLVMLPDGTIVTAPTRAHAERIVRKWCERTAAADAVNACVIDWRL